jgi:hypothetical protein
VHNVQRSSDMILTLKSIGLNDNSETRAYLKDFLTNVLNDEGTIVGHQANGRTVRRAFMQGKTGGALWETVWDGNKLVTGVIFKDKWK